jgi:hypothetical protein
MAAQQRHRDGGQTLKELSATGVMTGTIPAGLRRRQHSGKVVAVSLVPLRTRRVGLGWQSSSEQMQNSVECLTEKIHEVAHSFFVYSTPRGHCTGDEERQFFQIVPRSQPST